MAEKVSFRAHQTGTGHLDLHQVDLHQAIGGTATCCKLSEAFYGRVKHDSLLRPLFPGKTLHCAIEEFTAFLVHFFGGPSEDAQRRWWLSLRESHLRFKLGPEERAAWMSNMVKALDDVKIGEPMRSALREFFERSSAYVVNSGKTSPDIADRMGPHGDAIHQEVARRWDAQRWLDEAVAAVRAGDAEHAITMAESAALQTCFKRNRSVFAGLLALMIGSRNDAMLWYVQEKITDDPALTEQRYAGRTLLHEASAQGGLNMVEFLLNLGADPNAADGGGHAPLYSLANECKVSGGGDVVRVLVQHGANVNTDGGVKHCTALHMAARRGSVEIAEALLDCGADIEARDSLGDTPLRRSVNCDKPKVAALLLKRGANIHSIGNKGLTPLLAARSSVMKQLLRSSVAD